MEDGFCLGQGVASEKSNETTAIPELLDKIQIKGQIITIDAMGTQKAIAEKSGISGQTMFVAFHGEGDVLFKSDVPGRLPLAPLRFL